MFTLVISIYREGVFIVHAAYHFVISSYSEESVRCPFDTTIIWKLGPSILSFARCTSLLSTKQIMFLSLFPIFHPFSLSFTLLSSIILIFHVVGIAMDRLSKVRLILHIFFSQWRPFGWIWSSWRSFIWFLFWIKIPSNICTNLAIAYNKWLLNQLGTEIN